METLTYLKFVAGFVFLIKGADLLVEGAGAIARKYRISEIVIGLTIVSFGTSLPELIVNLFASFDNNEDMAVGNILGSNISNIFLIIGIASIIYPLGVKRNTIRFEIPFSAFGSVIIFLLANFHVMGPDSDPLVQEIARVDGIILLTFFTGFMYYIGTIARDELIEEVEIPNIGAIKSITFIVLGIAGLGFGGNWIVEGGEAIAHQFNFSEALIGLTVIAIGTSLPELATSAMAAYKRNTDIAVGNVVGSNIFNIFWILGASSIIKPIPFNQRNNTDILITLIVSFVLFIFIFIGNKREINRWKGIIFVLFYIIYSVFVFYRG